MHCTMQVRELTGELNVAKDELVKLRVDVTCLREQLDTAHANEQRLQMQLHAADDAQRQHGKVIVALQTLQVSVID